MPRYLTLLFAIAGALFVQACGPAGERAGSPQAQPATTPVAAPPAAPSVAPALQPGATAAETAPRPELDACLNAGEAAAGVTPAMAACSNAEVERRDAALNAAYKAAMSRLEPTQKEKLRAAQRAWIKFRDEKCAAEASSGGTIDRLNGPACLADATARRTAEIEAFAP